MTNKENSGLVSLFEGKGHQDWCEDTGLPFCRCAPNNLLYFLKEQLHSLGTPVIEGTLLWITLTEERVKSYVIFSKRFLLEWSEDNVHPPLLPNHCPSTQPVLVLPPCTFPDVFNKVLVKGGKVLWRWQSTSSMWKG